MQVPPDPLAVEVKEGPGTLRADGPLGVMSRVVSPIRLE